MSVWDALMTKHGYTSAAAVPAEPPAGVLTSAWLLEKQAADAVKIRQENVEIEREEAADKAKGIIRPGSPPRGPGPHTCPSCGTRPWKPLWNDLCDGCGLQVALNRSWEAAGCWMPQNGTQQKKKEKADSDDNDDDDDAPKPPMSNRAKKAAGRQRGQPRQCPKCNKKTWEHMPLGTCDRCGMREAMDKSWIACHKDKNGSTHQRDSARQNNQQSHLISSDPRQTAASSSWQAPQLQAPWRYEPPPGLSASSSSQAPSGIIRTTSRHNKIPSTHSSAS